jgi:hypothetical protein
MAGFSVKKRPTCTGSYFEFLCRDCGADSIFTARMDAFLYPGNGA